MTLDEDSGGGINGRTAKNTKLTISVACATDGQRRASV
jgi:hypothetical protein